MLRLYTFCICWSCFIGFLPGQGKLLLVGGGREQAGAWSDAPYRWAVEQAPNQRVAIIEDGESSEWLGEYFVSLGAHLADNIQINDPKEAQATGLYDRLMGYDLLFFNGGNQAHYYRSFRSTPVARAIQDKYRQGGVIGGTSAGMAMLSKVIFTADSGALHPAEALENLQHPRLRLSQDFLPFFEDFLFDPHFAERGRLGRMLAFLARWQLDHGEALGGVGVDDETAICIDAAGLGTVYGTGRVSILLNDLEGSRFRMRHNRPVIDSLRLIQLTEGLQFDFVSWESLGFSDWQSPSLQTEERDCTLMLAGGDSIQANLPFLSAFVEHVGHLTDGILVVSSPGYPKADSVAAILESLGAVPVTRLAIGQQNQHDPACLTQVRNTHKFLFLGNDPDSLFRFLLEGPCGSELYARIFTDGAILAFMGADASLVGPRYVVNPQTQKAAYQGGLRYAPGLGILNSSLVMPKSYGSEYDPENAQVGVCHGLVHEALGFGWWLSEGTYAYYRVTAGQTWLSAHGKRPLLLLHHRPAYIRTTPIMRGQNRQRVAFSHFTLSLIDSLPRQMGSQATVPSLQLPQHEDWIVAYPNPVQDRLSLFFYGHQKGRFEFQLLDPKGKQVAQYGFRLQGSQSSMQIMLPKMPPGIYKLIIKNAEQRIIKRLPLFH